MSKVIVKIGPETNKLERDQIKTLVVKDKPRVTFKYATDNSVVFFDRNPFYVIMTREEHVRPLMENIELLNSGSLSDEESKQAIDRMETIVQNELSIWIQENIFGEFSTTVINALKNAKAVGMKVSSSSMNEKHEQNKNK